jgi:hypothetical protein
MEAGNAYAGRLRGGVPPTGSLVYYGGANGFGHVGISLGYGWVVSTSGFDNQGLPNKLFSYNQQPEYRGWVLP